jgi:hypothetical protein
VRSRVPGADATGQDLEDLLPNPEFSESSQAASPRAQSVRVGPDTSVDVPTPTPGHRHCANFTFEQDIIKEVATYGVNPRPCE